MFAGWDETIHAGRLSSSPSIQVRRTTLEAAFDNGLHASLRHSEDVVVAFTPSLLATYCLFAEEIRAHPDSSLVADLNLIPSLSGGVVAPPSQSVDRPRVVRVVESSYRAWDFNARVMKAYGGMCAVCGLQLGLIEAAHIVPMAWAGSTDLTRNGIALCRNHHPGVRRFAPVHNARLPDRGLCFFRDLQVSRAKAWRPVLQTGSH